MTLEAGHAVRRSPVRLQNALVVTAGTLGVAAAAEAGTRLVSGRVLSDLPGRFVAWNLHPSLLPYQGRPIEYPVGIGFLAWITTWFGHHAISFLVANSVVAAGLALGMTVVLHDRGGSRIWRWAAGVPLALYAFHNWDLAAIVPAVIALFAFERGRDRTSGVLLAVGASTKVFPGLFVPPLAFVRWRSGDRRGAVRLLGAFVIVTVLLNAPIAWRDWNAWTFPAKFQGDRAATWGTLWFWLDRIPGVDGFAGGGAGHTMNILAIAAMAVALIVISSMSVARDLDAVQIGAAVVGVMLLTNKIYSPNYDLWIVPFFVLLPVSRRAWIAFSAAVLGIFVLVFGSLHGAWSHEVVTTLLLPFVLLRAAGILVLIATALRTRVSPRIADSGAGPAETSEVMRRVRG